MAVAKRIGLAVATVFAVYFLFFTGPQQLSIYPDPVQSPYLLPWAGGVSRFVSQGNHSFTTHRGQLEYSWDFWMAIGTEVRAARGGRVVEVVDQLYGIGWFRGNRIVIEHDDGTRALYAHLRKDSAYVKVGETVAQGGRIGLSGMVGMTINPHLHFEVMEAGSEQTVPITFRDAEGGIPRAGHYYSSKNSSLDQRPNK